ncbi:hypothetical protein [Bradyrhizobium sp.]|uniref:hypothetical protein n=1 Tax=Bradyrhizobium sp. TaxID=376 RepID=UPI0025C142C5|nr:hypothetical protein [Bradyrhizobium sp.]
MADPMASLTVRLDAPSNLRWSGTFPVEVRDCARLVLTARGVSGGKLEVPAGRYFVTAMLPNGQQASVDDIVDLKAGEDREVRVSVTDLDFPVPLQNVTTLGDSVREFARPVTQYFTSHNVAILKGNWLAARIAPNPAPLLREPTARSSLEIRFADTGEGRASWLEISGSGKSIYIAVPVDQGRSTTVQWELNSRTEELKLRFDFNEGELNSFFDFIRSDQAREARAIGQSIIAQSERYMTDRTQSPLRAILGAYVLLRADELDGMNLWTGNLVNWCGWSPDALALRIEYLARAGDHEEALKLLLKVPNCGTPWFRSGVGYLEKRAKLYVAVAATKRSSLQIGQADLDRITRIATVFGELAAALDMAHSTSVFRMPPVA